MSGRTSRQPRPGAAGRTKTGKPRPGTGGYGKRKLEGKGPTPPASMRPGHPAQRRAAAQARAAARPADRPDGRRPDEVVFSSAREDALRRQIASNDHAPENFRISTVRNIDAWYDAFDVRRTELEALRHELDYVIGNPVVVRFLAKMQNRDARRHFIGVARQDFVELLLRFRAECECHELSEGCEAAIFRLAGARATSSKCWVLPGVPPGGANRSDPESGVSRAEQNQTTGVERK